MKAIFQTKYGKPEVLQVGEQPTPVIGKDEVLIENYATSVNPRDCLIRAGRYQLQFKVPGFPLILGSDCAGVIVKKGSEVTNFNVGDRVYGFKNPSHGLATYAQYVSINKNLIALSPIGMDLENVAGTPLCSLTAWQALVDKAGLKPKQRVLILGASGGVGTYALQIAKAKNAFVDATCSKKNIDYVKSLGANQVYDYSSNPLKELPGYYDIIFDTIGSSEPSKCAHLMRSGGTFITTVPAPKLIFKSIISGLMSSVHIPHVKTRVVMVKPKAKQLSEITKLIEEGKVIPQIDSRYEMADAQLAHVRSQSKRGKGKIIILTK